jgi:hypothetical protein
MKMNQQKKIRLIIGIAALVAVVLAIVLLVVGILYSGSVLAKTLLIIE